ncbi:MAG: AEC family transporter [Parabacteroides sp.]|nr:AEC family transporter [Parabacteroides sp.]MDO4755116.1 AEC family transporter [Parabacteroides sp.]
MLNPFYNAFEGILTIITVVFIGYILNKRGWFDEKSSQLIARLVTNVSLPLYIITNLTKIFTLEKLIGIMPDMVVPVLSMLLAMIIGVILARFFKVKSGRKGVFITNTFIANTMFIGLPVNLALFGDVSIPSVMVYYVINLLLFWTLGVRFIIRDVQIEDVNILSFSIIKKLMSPPMMGFIIAILFIAFNLKLPVALFNGFKYVGNLTTPLSLMFIGIEISKINMKEFRFTKDIVGGLIGRFVVCPLSVLMIAPFFPVSTISAQVFTMQACMPAMTQIAVVAKQYNADSQYAATLSFITILCGMVIIPFYMYVISLLF